MVNKIEYEEGLAETIRLYQTEQLSIKQIANRLNLSYQAIHLRLTRAGVNFRPKRHDVRQTIDRGDLIRLYVEEGHSIAVVGRLLNVAYATVVRELDRFSIERRARHFEKRVPTPLDTLRVGESAIIECKDLRIARSDIHRKASVRNIKISIHRLDRTHARVTRTQ